MRIGHGYDVHKFAENRRLIIGGTEIPFELGLLGHSDADVRVSLQVIIKSKARRSKIGRAHV